MHLWRTALFTLFRFIKHGFWTWTGYSVSSFELSFISLLFFICRNSSKLWFFCWFTRWLFILLPFRLEGKIQKLFFKKKLEVLADKRAYLLKRTFILFRNLISEGMILHLRIDISNCKMLEWVLYQLINQISVIWAQSMRYKESSKLYLYSKS